MNAEEQLEWIERYLEGKLSEEELKIFEQKMASDSSFAAEVKLQKDIAEAMTEADVVSLSEKIRFIQHQKMKPSERSGRIILFKRLLQIAAGFALLVAVYFVYENFNQNYTPQELAAQYFLPDEQISHSLISIDRSSNPDSSLLLQNALNKNIDAIWIEIESLYIQKNFRQALDKLSDLQNLDPSFEAQSPSEFYYFEGLFLLLSEDPNAAIQAFQKVKTTYTEKATWYSALAYLQLDDIENAKKQLEKILSNGLNPFKEPAATLMTKIDQIK